MKLVIDTSKSPYAKLKQVPLDSIRINDEFWKPRLETLRKVTIPFIHEQLEKTGRIENFRRVARGDKNIEWRIADDSDVYKWVEASSYVLAYKYDSEIDSLLKEVVKAIEGAQDDDGYLFTYYAFDKSNRWKNLRDMHELYCAGHLIQAAIAYYRSTERNDLLNTSIKLANHITNVFERKIGAPGHPEIEMALVELYRTTRNRKYLETSKIFIERRGHGILGGSELLVDHKPFKELNEIVGHAVRSLYLNCGATDVFLETGDKDILRVLKLLWDNMVNKKMYITGGVGSRYTGESFGDEYELPDRRAYAETCAAVANVMWNIRMFYATGDAKYIDIVELALYNGALSGISLDGKRFFYVNPLADRGKIRRKPWYSCACCPTNIIRLLAYLPGIVYSLSNDGIWFNIYVQNTARVNKNGNLIEIREKTKYPWNGSVEIEVCPSKEEEFSIYLRIPGWCKISKIYLNERLIGNGASSSYFKINRAWRCGDTIKVNLGLKVELISANPHALCLWKRVALKRGPIVYCFESADNPGIDVWNIAIGNAKISEIYDPKMLNGIVYLELDGHIIRANKNLYFSGSKYNIIKKKVKAIPYYAWANRSRGSMIVWIKH